MQERGQIDDAAVQAMDDEVKAEVQDAWDFAEASPEPGPDALFADVLADTTS
jgi:TPP-dependent pyruvate/acetoin dehydrogenase alpha subunit